MRFEIKITVDYDDATLEHFSVEDHLEMTLDRHIGEGMLTGYSEAVIDDYSISIEEVPSNDR